MMRNSEAALVLAPMEGVTDAPMRALQTETGAFTFAVSEFLRVSAEPLSPKSFRNEVPELSAGAVTPCGVPVQVQILGGDPDKMAISAATACRCGATAIDINFGCPAQTVNRHDGGATLLKYPHRIREIVRAVRDAVPVGVPVSAKLRLGWDTIEPIHENAEMAALGGADWITIHARTRLQGYDPPVFWRPIGEVRRNLRIPVVANGDIWTVDDFHRCQDQTRCVHFMIGRGALANPGLSTEIAQQLGCQRFASVQSQSWVDLLERLLHWTAFYAPVNERYAAKKMKQWLRMASHHGAFTAFDEIKRLDTPTQILGHLHPLPALSH